MSMDNFFREHPLLPKIRSRDNSLARIALWVMIEKAAKAGVKWKSMKDVREQILSAIEPVGKSHRLRYLHELVTDPFLIEQELWIENPNFRNLIAPFIHDSRLAVDLPQRNREVYFCGKPS